MSRAEQQYETRTDADSWPEPRKYTGNVTVLIPVEFPCFGDDAQAALQIYAETLASKLSGEFRAAVELVDTELDGADTDERGAAS